MNTQAINRTYRIIITASVLVILAAGVLSFTALFDLFIAINLFWWPLAILFPLLFDLAEVTAAVTVFNAKLQGEEDKFAWRLVLLFTLLGIIANVSHAAHAYHIARIDAAQFVLAVGATSLFPVSIALVTHLLKRTIERHLRREAAAVTLAEMSSQIETAKIELSKIQAEMLNTNVQFNREKATLESGRADLREEIEQLTAERDRLSLDVQTVDDIPVHLRQAVEVDALLYAGWTKKATAEAVGISRTTLNNREEMVNGSGLRHRNP